MLLDLRSQLSLGLASLRSRFPHLDRFCAFPRHPPGPPPTHCGSVLRELGYQAIRDAFRTPSHESDGLSIKSGETSNAPFETPVTRARRKKLERRRNRRNGGESGATSPTLTVRPPSSCSSYTQESYAMLESLLEDAIQPSSKAPASRSEANHGEESTRDGLNGEYAASDKTTIRTQRVWSTNNSFSRDCEHVREQQKRGVMTYEGDESRPTPYPVPKTPPNAFHITTFSASIPSRRARAKIEFVPVEVQDCEDLRPEVISPRALLRGLEEDDPIPIPCRPGASSASSWSNGLFDSYGSPIQRVQPSGPNYFPACFRNRRRVYKKFSPAPPFNPFNNRYLLPTPSITSDEEEHSDVSESSVARSGKPNAVRELQLRAQVDRSNIKKPSPLDNVDAPPESSSHDNKNQSQEAFGPVGGRMQEKPSPKRALLDDDFTAWPHPKRRIEFRPTYSKLLFPPKDATVVAQPGQQREGEWEAKNWLTHPMPPGHAGLSKRRGSVFDVDDALLRPRRKYRLYERPQERTPEGKSQTTFSSDVHRDPSTSLQEPKPVNPSSSTSTAPLWSFENPEFRGPSATRETRYPVWDPHDLNPPPNVNFDNLFPREILEAPEAAARLSGNRPNPQESVSENHPYRRNIWAPPVEYQQPWDNGEESSAHVQVPPQPIFAQAPDVHLQNHRPQRISPQVREKKNWQGQL